MEDLILQSESFSSPIPFSVENGVLKLGEGDQLGYLSFDEQTGELSITSTEEVDD